MKAVKTSFSDKKQLNYSQNDGWQSKIIKTKFTANKYLTNWIISNTFLAIFHTVFGMDCTSQGLVDVERMKKREV